MEKMQGGVAEALAASLERLVRGAADAAAASVAASLERVLEEERAKERAVHDAVVKKLRSEFERDRAALREELEAERYARHSSEAEAKELVVLLNERRAADIKQEN